MLAPCCIRHLTFAAWCPLPPLLQTHSELAETRAELEQLADDILAIKMLMDDDSEGGAPADAGAGYAPASYVSAAPAAVASAAAGDDDTLDILESLAALSRQLAADAAEDDAIVQALATSWAEGEQPAAGARVQ